MYRVELDASRSSYNFRMKFRAWADAIVAVLILSNDTNTPTNAPANVINTYYFPFILPFDVIINNPERQQLPDVRATVLLLHKPVEGRHTRVRSLA